LYVSIKKTSGSSTCKSEKATDQNTGLFLPHFDHAFFRKISGYGKTNMQKKHFLRAYRGLAPAIRVTHAIADDSCVKNLMLFKHLSPFIIRQSY